MMDYNQERVSVAETSTTSEEKRTNLTLSARSTREISSGFCPEIKVQGPQNQSILTNSFPHNNIIYKKKVVVQEVHYSIYYVIVTDK